ncbi:hypothetical protein GCM10011504_34840 [Siccirubricoccus deserti]|uniref:Uncharacterized protein n=1 Tax=Siccirubricoccus deserti TaxID=2013562 RepID=A0A9X0QZH5_9PROT|nr:hypothetical protein [Siccirubricoccus deserti]MBC4016889.1 hypothetical protein [Siccirubricoccus deserti]GGC53514.1 hypothetical protein GCM10011504_34840 [Siccirubricoccus deserti]
MVPIEPEYTAYNTEEEPWRLARLIRTDGRVREMLRILTAEAMDNVGSQGELIWTRHVRRLHDDRGTLQAHVTAALGGSAWLAVIALALSRAWDGEDEAEVEFLVEGEPIPWPLEAILGEP